MLLLRCNFGEMRIPSNRQQLNYKAAQVGASDFDLYLYNSCRIDFYMTVELSVSMCFITPTAIKPPQRWRQKMGIGKMARQMRQMN